MAFSKVAARSQTVSVRPSVAPVAAPVVHRPRGAAATVQAFVSQPSTASKAEQPSKSFLDMAMGVVMSLFDDQSQQQSASEELQLPPELKAYLEEMEAHEGGSHGGWVHSHIAERLASVSEDGAE